MLYVFFFNDTATTEIYTLSLHDALPVFLPGLILRHHPARLDGRGREPGAGQPLAYHYIRALERRVDIALAEGRIEDRKSTRLNSSHANISYAVFCLKKNNI